MSDAGGMMDIRWDDASRIWWGENRYCYMTDIRCQITWISPDVGSNIGEK